MSGEKVSLRRNPGKKKIKRLSRATLARISQARSPGKKAGWGEITTKRRRQAIQQTPHSLTFLDFKRMLLPYRRN